MWKRERGSLSDDTTREEILEKTTFCNKPDSKKQFTDSNKGHVNNFTTDRIA